MIARTLAFLSVLAVAPGALAAADLTTSISASVTPQLVYVSTTYTVTVTNNGNKNASACSATVTLPATHTSPQVYIMGNLGTYTAGCSLSGQTISCPSLGTINRFGGTRQIQFNLALPVSSAPIVIGATAATTSAENSTTNNASSYTAPQSYYATTITPPVGGFIAMTNSHCTGTGLTAYFECTKFPSSITSHPSEFHDGGAITIPGEPAYGGSWSVTPTANGNRLDFYYEEIGVGTVATFVGWGASGSCFEGMTTFPGSTYVSPYRVCP